MFDELILALTISFLLTIVIYLAPIAIYRFLIVKKPLPKKKALTVAIIWGIIGWTVFNVVRGAIGEELSTNVAPAFLWGYVNYHIMKKQNKSGNNPEDEVTN